MAGLEETGSLSSFWAATLKVFPGCKTEVTPWSDVKYTNPFAETGDELCPPGNRSCQCRSPLLVSKQLEIPLSATINK